MSLGYFGILKGAKVVEKVEVEVEMESEYGELAKAFENFGNRFYIFLFFLFFFSSSLIGMKRIRIL